MNDNRHQDGIYPFPAGMQSREIETNGAKIHVRVGGHGPAVVMLHGFGTTGDMWGHEQPQATTDLVVDFLRRAR
jgi:pimeloyl-ACP methyl ester carboxylesterase